MIYKIKCLKCKQDAPRAEFRIRKGGGVYKACKPCRRKEARQETNEKQKIKRQEKIQQAHAEEAARYSQIMQLIKEHARETAVNRRSLNALMTRQSPTEYTARRIEIRQATQNKWDAALVELLEQAKRGYATPSLKKYVAEVVDDIQKDSDDPSGWKGSS